MIKNTRELPEYKKNLKLTSFQRQVILGSLLGDAHLETFTNGNTYRLLIEQSKSKHSAYVYHLYEVLKPFFLSAPKELTKMGGNGKPYVTLQLKSITFSSFRFYAQLLYKGRTKRIPKNIHKFLTPVALAYWYMDDGALKGQDRLGKRLHTEGFEEKDVRTLCRALNEIGIETTVQRQNRKVSGKLKTYYILNITANGDREFTPRIEPHVIPEMLYKVKPTKLPKR